MLQLQKQDRRQSIASSREWIFAPSYKHTLLWARTATNTSATKARWEAEHCCYLQKGYLHQATNSHLLWARTATNASCEPEQLQMLQLIGGRALQKGCLHQATNSQSEMLHVGQYNASRGSVQCTGASLLYTGSTVQC